MQKDLDETPSLLEWYKRRGFIVLEPDADFPFAERPIKKVTQRL